VWIGARPKIALATLAIALASRTAFAIELGLETQTGNLHFPWSPTTPTTAASFPTSNFYFAGKAWMNAPLGEDASIQVLYDLDPVLRNSAVAAVKFERGIASIAVGPLFGFLNSSSSAFSAGISAQVRLQWPGVAYVSMRSDGGTAISIFQADSSPQARTELSAGLYVPNAILSAVVSAKRFNELDANGALVTDSLLRYAMTVDVFKKNVPYTALLSLGYELRSKRYAGPDLTDSLGSIVLGLDAAAQLSPALKLKGSFSTGAYVFGLDGLRGRGPGPNAFLFNAGLGLSIDLAQLESRPKVEAPAEGSGEVPANAGQLLEEGGAAPPKDEAQPADAAPVDADAAEKPEFSRFDFRFGPGLYYNNKIKLSGQFAALGALFNTRVGAWARAAYAFTPQLSLGAELGIDYLTLSISGVDGTLYDVPLRASLRYGKGKMGVEGFGGVLLSGATVGSESAPLGTSLDFGARFSIAGLFAEASYVIGLGASDATITGVGTSAASFPRFGLGYAFKLGK
jgi:hypothetical protein